MYIAKYLRKISTFPLNFKYYVRILKASTLYKDCAKYKNLFIGLLLQALSWGKDMVAMSGDGPRCRPSLLHHTCITWFIMSHKWWKSMAVWGGLVDKVFLSIYMSKCMEHGKLNHLLFHDIRYKWIHISQSLGSQNSDYSNRNVLPTIQIPFWWICILSFILRCRDEKWWPVSAFSPKEQSLGCSHQPSPSRKTPEITTNKKMGKTGGMKKKKGWSEASEKNLNSTTSSS